MSVVEANGLTLGYDTFGKEADETVLLISGLGVQRLRWAAAFCELLAGLGFRVIRFDNRDAGESTHLEGVAAPGFAELAAAFAAGRRPEVPYTLHDLAADTAGLMDALGVDRAHVVGRSMGGMVAQLLAATRPERVLSLVSVMSSTGNPGLPAAAPDVMAMLSRPAPHPREDEAGFLAHGVAFARRLSGSSYPLDEDAHRALLSAELRRGHDPAAFGRQIAGIAATGDLRALLAGIRAPTLVVHGGDDPLIPPACGQDTAASIPGAEFLLLDGMGHELPAALYETVARAIASNARRSR